MEYGIVISDTWYGQNGGCDMEYRDILNIATVEPWASFRGSSSVDFFILIKNSSTGRQKGIVLMPCFRLVSNLFFPLLLWKKRKRSNNYHSCTYSELQMYVSVVVERKVFSVSLFIRETTLIASPRPFGMLPCRINTHVDKLLLGKVRKSTQILKPGKIYIIQISYQVSECFFPLADTYHHECLWTNFNLILMLKKALYLVDIFS